MTHWKTLLAGLLIAALTACASNIHSSVNTDTLDSGAKWVLLPIANNTDTPQAGLSAEAMVEHQLRLRGIHTLERYPAALSRDSLFEPTERKVSEESKKWAKEQGMRFAVMGSVEEWRYKVGIDGEPAVGVSLIVVDLSTDRVVWSASGGKSGWSRQALSAVAQTLLTDIFASLRLSSAK